MLIECLIRRVGGTTQIANGNVYRFVPNKSGAHVAEVAESDIENFLHWPLEYRAWFPGAKNPWRPAADYIEPMPSGTELPAGASPNLDEMTREQLLAYASNLGMRQPHPKIRDDTLRANIAAFLETRQEQIVPEADDEADETEGDDESEESE
ncbi:MAG: hypothetical protein J0H00_10820 [Burkholderiales bacterium]|nr:hypothetical protein [Burkholderiales bacterium]